MTEKMQGSCSQNPCNNSERCARTETINKNKDFLNIYRRGETIVSKHIVIYVKKNVGFRRRLGITAGKKVGNAVKRNRAKRIIRQAFRESEAGLPVGIDIVIVARPSICGIKSTELSEYLKNYGVSKIRSAVFGKKEK